MPLDSFFTSYSRCSVQLYGFCAQPCKLQLVGVLGSSALYPQRKQFLRKTKEPPGFCLSPHPSVTNWKHPRWQKFGTLMGFLISFPRLSHCPSFWCPMSYKLFFICLSLNECIICSELISLIISRNQYLMTFPIIHFLVLLLCIFIFTLFIIPFFQ